MTSNSNHGRPDRSREYDDVLVPTDGSACARVGARHGIRIARGFDARVHAVHALDVGTGVPPLELSRSPAKRDERRAAGEEIVDEVAKDGDDAGVDVVTELADGGATEALQDYLSDNDIDFVAMGTRGRSNIERHLLGSVTERLVRTSPVPVLTVGTEKTPETSTGRTYTDLLLPTRGGDGSRLAVDHAVSLAARFDATLHVLYVVDVRSQAAKRDTYELEPLVGELRTAVTDEAVDRADAAGVDARAVIQQGTPHSAIQRYSDEHDVDLIVMGTHGRGRIEQFLLGSITERTIRTADIPVGTVRLDEWFGADGGT
jgi:nucleotide-binding universal stress UspA family protein